MAKARTIRELTSYMMRTRSAVIQAHSRALIQVASNAELLAKKNSKEQFTGRNGRTLTGRLLNSIFKGFEFDGDGDLPTAFIGTRGIPYGRIHEYGGKIEPKKAKYLWLKNHRAKAFKRLTPSQWFTLFMNSRASKISKKQSVAKFRFSFNRTGKPWAAGVESNKEFVPLFFLKDMVKIPARPYLTPAAKEAVKNYPAEASKQLRKLLSERFFGKG